MDEFTRVLITGASGAIGTAVVVSVIQQYPNAEIICVLRNMRSADRLSLALPRADFKRLKLLYADLAADGPWPTLEVSARCLAIHCAGDVSWTKSERLMWPTNVLGTMRFAEMARASSASKPAFIFLSTAFIGENGVFRNAYEKTKAHAEQLLMERYRDTVSVAIVRCSLVVGSSEDGAIHRFNGLYPLVRLIALGEVPCVIADTTYRLDIVPVDTVVAEVLGCAAELENGAEDLKVVVACGAAATLPIGVLVEQVVSHTNRRRDEVGLAPLPSISVISNRQFQFLIKAAKGWDLARRFENVERINSVMSGYISHGESERPITPIVLLEAPPEPTAYMHKVIQYWLHKNDDRVIANQRRTWQHGAGDQR